MDDDQNAQEERDDISGPQIEKQEGEGNEIGSSSRSAAGAVSRERNQAQPAAGRFPPIRLPRFGVVREHDFLNPGQPAKTHRVPTDPDGGGGAVLVLEKDLRWTDAAADYNLLSVSEADGAGTLLRALTDEEWWKASPANYIDFVKVLATGPNDVEYELHLRHCVRGNEPPEYDLTHEWSRVVTDFGLKPGNTVEGWGYRDAKDDQLRLELKFSGTHSSEEESS